MKMEEKEKRGMEEEVRGRGSEGKRRMVRK